MNYWKIEFNDLPSLGLYYSKDTEIRIRTMTVRDVKYLATFNKTNAITITNELLNRCLKLKNLKFEDILLADREYLIFWLRTNTFIRSSGYQIKIPECPTCKNAIEQEIKLNQFKTDFIKSKFEECILNGINLTIPLKHPRIKDLKDAIGSETTANTILKRIKDVETAIGSESTANTVLKRIKDLEDAIGADNQAGTIKGRIYALEDHT